MDNWDQWLDEYVKDQLPPAQSPEPPASKVEGEESRSSGWYTGQRKRRSKGRTQRKSSQERPAEKKRKEGSTARPDWEERQASPTQRTSPTRKKRPEPKTEPKPEPRPEPIPQPVPDLGQEVLAEDLPETTLKKKWGSGRPQRITGLRRRWLFNSMSMVSLVLIMVLVISCVFVGTYYYSAMESGLETKAQTAAEFFTNYTTEAEYRERAAYYAANYSDIDSVELEFLNRRGEIILSSYAYQQTSGVSPGTVDVSSALTTGKTDSWSGTDLETGEHIMAVSSPVVQNGEVKGVIRMVTSMSAVDQQVLLIWLAIFLVCALVWTLLYMMNIYFVRSIIEPMAAITETAKRIAAGSYGVQIEKKYDDEIGQLADTINDMSRKISQTEKMKSEFISSVSHELRTPLTAINGWGETLLRREVTDPRDVHKGMAIIVSEARRLTKMVEELLEFSRIEDGRFTLNMEMVDIKAELEDAVYSYREFFRKMGITLEYNETEQEFPPIPGDPERLRQVFSNLLDNAAKHGGSGDRITVSIRGDGNYVAIRIRDYGPGVPPAELPHVKTKFYKGSSKARGSGIGLAVCDEIAVRHNGSLEIANAVGGGCAVTLRLPYHGES